MESKYKSLAEWRKAEPSAYNSAYRKGLIPEICKNFSWYYFDKQKILKEQNRRVKHLDNERLERINNDEDLKNLKNKLDSLENLFGVVDIYMDSETLNIVTPYPINSILSSYNKTELINCSRFEKISFLDNYYFCKVKLKHERFGLIQITIPLSLCSVDSLVIKLPIIYHDENYYKIINNFYNKWKPIVEKEKKEFEKIHNIVMKELFGNDGK